MPRFLYRFGYENPNERRLNEREKTDFESSTACFIEAPDADAALEWGREVSQAFVRWLFLLHGESPPDWKQAGFAHWIDTEPVPWPSSLPCVTPGQLPDFEAL